jgi:ABC-type phosphate transport system substrate-binding protein
MRFYLQAAMISLLLVPVMNGPALAEQLRGPAFTDQSSTVYVEQGWETRGLAYEPWAQGADLAVTLDQHLYPALMPLIQGFAQARGLNIPVQEGTCGISAGKLQDRSVDIAGFCCPPGLTDRLPGLRFHTLAIGALALLVHRDNPVADIDLDTARDIFRGRSGYWRVLGDEMPPSFGGRSVRPVGRLHCKTRPGHWRLLLDNEDLFSPRLSDVSTIPDMIASVERDREAIGYEMLWMVQSYSREGKIKILRLNGQDPADNGAVVSGKYPLYRTYNITTWSMAPARKALAEELVAYLLANFDQVDPKYGLIPAQQLRSAGWRFDGDELMGEPDPKP